MSRPEGPSPVISFRSRGSSTPGYSWRTPPGLLCGECVLEHSPHLQRHRLEPRRNSPVRRADRGAPGDRPPAVVSPVQSYPSPAATDHAARLLHLSAPWSGAHPAAGFIPPPLSPQRVDQLVDLILLRLHFRLGGRVADRPAEKGHPVRVRRRLRQRIEHRLIHRVRQIIG